MLPQWGLDLQRIYEEQLEKLLIFRRIFDQLNHAWTQCDGTTTGGDLAQFMHDGYVAFACLAIRKMMDSDKGSVSLINPLNELRKPTSLPMLSRDTFAAHYQGAAAHFADRDYDLISDGDPDLTAARIDQHIAALKTATDPIRVVVNKVIAHTDRKHVNTTTYNDVKSATDALTGIFDRYSLLIRRHSIDLRYINDHFDVSTDIARLWSPK